MKDLASKKSLNNNQSSQNEKKAYHKEKITPLKFYQSLLDPQEKQNFLMGLMSHEISSNFISYIEQNNMSELKEPEMRFQAAKNIFKADPEMLNYFKNELMAVNHKPDIKLTESQKQEELVKIEQIYNTEILNDPELNLEVKEQAVKLSQDKVNKQIESKNEKEGKNKAEESPESKEKKKLEQKDIKVKDSNKSGKASEETADSQNINSKIEKLNLTLEQTANQLNEKKEGEVNLPLVENKVGDTVNQINSSLDASSKQVQHQIKANITKTVTKIIETVANALNLKDVIVHKDEVSTSLSPVEIQFKPTKTPLMKQELSSKAVPSLFENNALSEVKFIKKQLSEVIYQGPKEQDFKIAEERQNMVEEEKKVIQQKSFPLHTKKPF